MRYDNTKKITGSGKYGGYRGDILSATQAEKVARAISGGRIGHEAITFEGYKDHLSEPLPTGSYSTPAGKIREADIKSWNDRNISNKNTKLSKEKPLGPKKLIPKSYIDKKKGK